MLYRSKCLILVEVKHEMKLQYHNQTISLPKQGNKRSLILKLNQIRYQNNFQSFHKNSIPVRTHIGNGLMHNKFIILDKKVIITGSFNFTTSAIVDNHENVVVTDQLDIVGQYVSRFEKLWGLFDYNQDKKIKG